jgi:hypothetical protein
LIGEAIKELFQNASPISSRGYEIAFRKLERERRFFLSSNKIALNVLLLLKSDEIDFQSISDDLRRSAEIPDEARGGKIRCNWLVCSERGGIYLFEAIATKENRSRGNMRNRFVVLNTGDGTVSFGPGHEKNMEYTRRMRDLISLYRSIQPVAWNTALAKLVNELFSVLDF